MFAAGPARGLITDGGAFGAGVDVRAAGPPGAVVQAGVAATARTVSATATAVDRRPPASIYPARYRTSARTPPGGCGRPDHRHQVPAPFATGPAPGPLMPDMTVIA